MGVGDRGAGRYWKTGENVVAVGEGGGGSRRNLYLSYYEKKDKYLVTLD